MSLSPEWKGRVDEWILELKNQFYTPMGFIELKGFMTYEQLSAEEALKREFTPMPHKTKWGREWEYGWFQGQIVLPEKAEGKRVVLSIDLGGESTLFINGHSFGSRSKDSVSEQHHFICDQYIALKGMQGEKFDILVECYAGHEVWGHGWCATGPVPSGRYVAPDLEVLKREVGECTYGIWNEAVYQLYLDVRMLVDIINNIDADSLRAAEIERALKDFSLAVDFEQPEEEMNRSLEEGRRLLKPLMECVNGSTSPVMYMFGHSHLDIAWLWPIAETERKCSRTLATQLRHMDEYPEYIFMQTQPQLYVMTRERYPELYEAIKVKVKAGQMIPEGGMWVEADTNITGGESLIRQFIHGKKFFKEEFGINSEILWLPDVFGYSAALPQIMKGCGIKYFSTQKLFWNYNGGEPFPYHCFEWQGLDGSEVTSFIFSDTNSSTDAQTIIQRWKNRVQKDSIKSFLFPFGYGDGGGGPTRDHIENVRRTKDIEGVPRTVMCSPVQFFKDQEKEGGPTKRYVGELYFQAHRGVNTSQAKTKKGNRKSEFALREVEMWGTAAKVLKGYDYPLAKMDATWKKVLLNQFHDILPGSSIGRVHKEAEALYEEILATAGEISSEILSNLTSQEEGFTVFNSLSWDRNILVELPAAFKGACTQDGKLLPVQFCNDKALVEVRVPSCGWITIKPGMAAGDMEAHVTAENKILENKYLRVEFNDKGEITSIFDKETQWELASTACNSLKMYKDVPRCFDAWDIDSTYELAPLALDETAEFEMVYQGPLVAGFKIIRKINNSIISQIVSLKHDSRRVDFETTVDWNETHKLLKVAFPVNTHAEEAMHEIQFGHIKRPNHRSRKYDEDRFEVCNHKWTALAEENRGFAVLNDCKYGINVLGNSINLTLLRAATNPDITADRGLQQFTYSFYSWNGTFMESDVVREAYELNCSVVKAAGCAGSESLFTVDRSNIIIETVKPAEDGSGDIIARLYECKRTAASCILVTILPYAEAFETDMLENVKEKLVNKDGRIALKFNPFEIKTIRLRRSDNDAASSPERYKQKSS